MKNYIGERAIRVVSVGDICPGDASIDGFGVLSVTRKHGADFPFRQLGNLFDGADLIVGNLEGTLSEQCRKKAMRMCGLPEFAHTLHEAGFHAISLANNHVYDHGPDVLEETISACREAGLKICGLRGTTDYYCEPVIVQAKSITIGILAYNWVGLEGQSGIEDYIAVVYDSVVNYTWNRTPAEDKAARDNVKYKNKKVLQDIKKLRQEVDVVVLIPHWGYEWTIYPPYGVVLEARAFIETGVDLILGMHPHTPQGVERYQKGVIYYSLGNFLFDMCSPRFRNGMIADVAISKHGVQAYQYHFTSTNRFFQPMPASRAEKEACISLIEESSSAITSDKARTRLDDELIYRQYERGYNQVKLDKIKYLLFSVFCQPRLLKPILVKTANLFRLLLLRAKGQKIRW